MSKCLLLVLDSPRGLAQVCIHVVGFFLAFFFVSAVLEFGGVEWRY